MVFTSKGSAMVTEPAKAAAPTPNKKRGPAKTMGFSSVGAAAINEAVAAVEVARAAPAAAAPVAAAPAAPASRPAAAASLPSYTLVNEREDNPSERSPLSYREYVYVVEQGTSDEDARRLILERFESVQKNLLQARPGKLINLAIFDHVFAGRPLRRPLVTLTWKDWKNEAPELQFPARDNVSMVPPSASLPAGPRIPSARPPPTIASVSESSPPASAPASAPATKVSATPEPAPKATSPAPAPVVVKAAPAPAASPAPSSAATPSSASPPASAKPAPAPAVVPRPTVTTVKSAQAAPKKRLSGEDLLTELFEAFNDLHFLRDAIEGAEFVLALTLEKLPSAVGMVSFFDMNKREFVIVRQTGGRNRAVGQRQPERAPIAGAAMRTRHAVVVSDPAEAKAATDERFKAIGVEIRSLICAPVELSGRYLGLIELVNPLDGSLFNEGDGNALTYIGQQFAEFAAARGVMIDPEQLQESASASRATPASSKRR